MRKLIVTSMLSLLSSIATAADNPDWAYPVNPPPPQLDNVTLKSLPGSSKQYTQAQIDDPFNPPDWFPDEHPPLPPVVASGGTRPRVACALCHLPSGNGHPESASLAGLNANYMIRQMQAFKDGDRKGIRAATMNANSKLVSDEEIESAVNYFAALKPAAGFNKVVETETVAKTYVGPGGMRFAVPNGGAEPIGQRIIVLPQDEARAHARDPKSGFIDYVPVGSIIKGAALMAGDNGKTVPCTICHGPTLKGLGEVPGIVGRPATYIFRQLNDMKMGNRKGPWVELMKQVVEKLNDEDMIALAAYLGSQDP
jgi:cytochrome c553